jgi:hypothetical protein
MLTPDEETAMWLFIDLPNGWWSFEDVIEHIFDNGGLYTQEDVVESLKSLEKKCLIRHTKIGDIPILYTLCTPEEIVRNKNANKI